MRIALIHSFYRSSQVSGENNTVLAQVEALREAGHEVELIAQYTDINQGRNPLYAIKAGFDVATGNGYDPTEQLLKFRPNVVWVHNLFPNFSTKWLANWQSPIVATLHNFRPLCVNGLLFRDDQPCTLCPQGKHLSAIKYACYRGSRLASVPLTIQNSKGINENPLLRRADKVILLSKLSLERYIKFGLDASRLEIIPNFITGGTIRRVSTPKNGRWMVASRLSREKGVLDLVKEWPDDYLLDIYGTGEEFDRIRAEKKGSISLKGGIPHADIINLMPQYLGLVFASKCWEQFGSAKQEALAAGLPVLERVIPSTSEEEPRPKWTLSVGDRSGLAEGSLQELLDREAVRAGDFRDTRLSLSHPQESQSRWVTDVNDLLFGLL